jgi:hypothetical protein
MVAGCLSHGSTTAGFWEKWTQMTRSTRTISRIGQGVLLLALTACGGGEADWVVPTPVAGLVGTQIRIAGTVRYYALEGGFYGIQGDDAVTYDPTNLPPAFRKEGLRVEAVARRRDDMMGIHQVGPIVDLERIRAR